MISPTKKLTITIKTGGYYKIVYFLCIVQVKNNSEEKLRYKSDEFIKIVKIIL